MNSNCPHCRGEIPAEARYCMHCGRIVAEYRNCPACGEPVAQDAAYCPYCTRKVPTELEERAKSFTASITASPIGAFFSGGGFTALIYPPRFEVGEGRIRLTKWSFLALRVKQHEVRLDRVASVKYTKGVVWGGIYIETFGGATEDISQNGFGQRGASQLAAQIKEIISV
jgi:RNA polymerase subunit RPABC4/transcription elongation factor Spt4